MKLLYAAAALLLAATAAACTPSARLNTPSGFAELEDQKPYAYRATSAQGVVVAVHTEPNRMKASVDFWGPSIDVRMRQKGYTAESSADVHSAAGWAGKQYRYVRESDRRTYRYWLTVFASDQRVYVVEAGGEKAAFDPAETAVTSAILSIRPD